MLKRIIIYGIGTFFSKILVFLMVPIYTRIFPTADFGYYDVLVADVQMVVSIAFVEVWSGIIRFMFDDKDRYRPIKTYLKILPYLFLLYLIGLFMLSRIISVKFPIITGLYGLLYLQFSVSNSICRGLEENIKYIISGIISTVVSCSFSILFSVFMHLGIEYILVSQCVGYAIAIVYVEFTTKSIFKCIKSEYQKGSIKELCKYCIPLMMNSFSFLFLGTFNKNIIFRNLGEECSGIYAYVNKFSAIISVLLSIYALAWQEQAFLSANDDSREVQYSHYLNNFFEIVGLSMPIYIIVSIIMSPYIGGTQYINSELYIPLVILSSYIANVSGVLSTVIAVNKKTNNIFISTAVGAVVNVVIAKLTIKNFGINAASLSLCIGFFVTSIMRYIFATREFKLDLEFKSSVIVVVEIAAIIYIQKKYDVIFLILLGVMFIIIWYFINLKQLNTILYQIKKILNIRR